jgi:hypothetical protein
MPDSPPERRRRAKASAPVPPDDPPSERPARERRETASALPSWLTGRAAMVWPLVTGLAIGFAVGREAWRFGGGSAGPAAPSSAFIAADPQGAGATLDFKPDWIKADEIGNGATIFAGLTEAQKTAVMAALNQRNCECGCGMGSVAVCLKKDPNCPRSPVLAKHAVDLVKQGKALPEVLAGIDAKQKELGGAAAKPQQEPPTDTTPKKVELAAWNPRKGPKAAKVTVVEFSDFQ